MDFKINKATSISTIEKWDIHFKYESKKWRVAIETHDGRVEGCINTNVATSDLDYFRYPDEIRKQHFEAFKKAILSEIQKRNYS
jgi:hypothetical protein